MIGRRFDVAVRTLLVFAASVVGFALLNDVARGAETRAAAGLVRILGAGHRVSVAPGHSILIVPYHHAANFRAVITPSCSALPSVLAAAALSSLSAGFAPARRFLATTVAIVTIAAGNIVRIAASVAFGLVAGKPSLVLFHDWFGALMTFVYTLGGFILMLYLLLPDRSREGASVSDGTPGGGAVAGRTPVAGRV